MGHTQPCPPPSPRGHSALILPCPHVGPIRGCTPGSPPPGNLSWFHLHLVLRAAQSRMLSPSCVAPWHPWGPQPHPPCPTTALSAFPAPLGSPATSLPHFAPPIHLPTPLWSFQPHPCTLCPHSIPIPHILGAPDPSPPHCTSIPSHSTPSHPTPPPHSIPIPSHPTQLHPTPSHPIPLNSTLLHPISPLSSQPTSLFHTSITAPDLSASPTPNQGSGGGDAPSPICINRSGSHLHPIKWGGDDDDDDDDTLWDPPRGHSQPSQCILQCTGCSRAMCSAPLKGSFSVE